MFREKTDISGVRKVMDCLLRLPIKQDEKFEFICHHPIFGHTPVTMNEKGEMVNLCEDEEELEKAIEKYSKAINEMELLELYIMVDTPYKLTFLKYAKDYMSRDDFSKLLSDAWTEMENPNADANVSKGLVQKWMKEANKSKLMEPDELEYYNGLPEKIRVYRGVARGRVKKGLSWTVNKEKAKWFADRFGDEGYVLDGWISKEDALAYFNRRGEDEIVVSYNDVKKGFCEVI